MIICPVCKHPLIDENHKLLCMKCGKTVKSQNGNLEFFISDEQSSYYPEEGIENLSQVDEQYFWFRIRNKMILFLLKRFCDKRRNFIEIGPGNCRMASTLIKLGFEVSVADIFRKSLKIAENTGVNKRYLMDITKTPFRNHFDIVGLFDVIEHIDDDILVMKNVGKMLKQSGLVILTVPAHDWLWSRIDTISGHKRRYTLKRVQKILSDNGFEVVFSSHFFVSILPLLFLRKIMNPDSDSETEKKELEKDFFYMPYIINNILYYISFFELFLLKFFHFPFGGSIVAVGRKKPH